MASIINGSSPTVTFSDGTTQATSAIVSGYVPYANLPAGSVLQVVQYSIQSQQASSSTTFVTSNLTGTITPKFATSKVLICVNGGKNYSSGGTATFCQLYRNGSALGAGAGWTASEAPATATGSNHSACYLDSPATTSTVTYTPYYRNGGSAGTVYFADGGSTAGNVTMTLMEIAA
jgi:hypothetical protein